MFRDTRRKKLRNRIIFSVVGAFVLSFGVWLNYQSAVDNDAAEEAAQKVRVEEDEKAETCLLYTSTTPKGVSYVKLVEPPLAEPHERWCERSEIPQSEEFPPTRFL